MLSWVTVRSRQRHDPHCFESIMSKRDTPKRAYFLETDQPMVGFSCPEPVRWSLTVEPGFHWGICVTSVSRPSLVAAACVPFAEMPEIIELKGTLTTTNGEPIRITPAHLYNQIVGSYDFAAVDTSSWWLTSSRPRIAFTVLAGSQRGGGTLQLYRYANWLVDLGFSVTIYSNDPIYPDWADLKARYLYTLDGYERYRSISEEIVIVYSILELPEILQSRNRSSQKILHFCQGLEEFHFGRSFREVMAPKPVFHLLNSLPVGRIVISPALEDYFKSHYKQKCFYIPNGLDPVFSTKPEQSSIKSPLGEGHRPIKIVQVCDPGQPLKGARVLFDAVCLLVRRYRDRGFNFHIDFLSGPSPTDTLLLAPAPTGVSYAIKSGLTPSSMREAYEAADVVVNASFHEGLGLSSLEALASGVFLIQADNFGLDGILEDGVNSITVPRDNVTALASALATLIEIPEFRRIESRFAQQIAHRFSIEKQFESFCGVFERITEVSGLRERSIAEGKCNVKSADNGMRVEVHELPRFSVLVPVYNHAHFLPETLDTLKSQTYPHWEAVIVNDGSTDDTPAVMRRYAADDDRFKLVHRENGGTAAALNTAFSNARNDWICWLSSDDFFKREKLEIHARYIGALPDVKFFHSLFSVFDEASKEERCDIPSSHAWFANPAFKALDMCRWNSVHGNTVAIHRDIFQRVGGFRSEFPSAQDYDMWLRMSLVTPAFLINKVTCTTRLHDASGSVNFPYAGIFDSYRSLIDVLNSHKFPEILPFLNLRRQRELSDAVIQCGLVSGEAESFLYVGTAYRRSPILERLLEFYGDPELAATDRQLVLESLQVARNVLSTLPNKYPFLDRHFERFKSAEALGYEYRPIDPFAEMVARYEQFLRTRDASKIALYRRYFTKLALNKVPGVPELDDIFGRPELHNVDLSLAQ